MRALSMVAVALALGACSDDAAPTDDAGRADAGRPDSGGRDADVPPGTDAGRADAGPGPAETVEVSHAREVRGAWIATVFNINWPSRSGLDATAQQRELIALLDAAERAGLNAVFLQIRAEADAFYRSDLEPWSRFLTGTQGRDPGYDPLSFAIDEAHARGLELHAWMNPYRALASADASVAAASHVLRARPDVTVAYGRYHWIDPGSEGGLSHTLAVIADVLERYDVDGVHFDDYFYPYPEAGVSFDDDASYAAYTSSGGTLGRADWRRDNVHRMVAAVHGLVAEARPDVRFGISPFGIYRPGMPSGISGLDPYDALYADPLEWMRQGWIDYLAPQLYWPTTRTAQAYGRLLDWWADQAVATGRTLLVGNYLAQLGSSSEWSLAEMRAQLDLTRAARDRMTRGNILYHAGPIVEDRLGIAEVLARDYYARPAATPALVDAEGSGPPAPLVTAAGADAVISAPPEGVRWWAAYRQGDAGFELERLVPAARDRATLWRGRWAVSAIDRRGLESRGAVVEIAEGDPPDEPDPPPPGGAECTHSFGGRYAHTACSASYQCCDGAWVMRDAGCAACLCVEESGTTGCGIP